VPVLRERKIRTRITRVTCGEDAVESYGLASAAVKARDMVVRSASVESMLADHDERT